MIVVDTSALMAILLGEADPMPAWMCLRELRCLPFRLAR